MTASDASGGARRIWPDMAPVARKLVRSQRSFLADSGRFVAIPGRRGKPGGVGAILRTTCSVRRSEPGNGATGADRLDREPEVRGGRGRVRRLLVVDRALPRDEHAALAQQRRGVLAEDGQRRERAGAHDVAAPEPVGPLLGAAPDDLDVGEAHRVAAARRNSHLRPTDSTRITRARGRTAASTRPGRPGARAEVGDHLRATELRDLEPGERVGDVHVAARLVDRAPRSAPRAPASRSSSTASGSAASHVDAVPAEQRCDLGAAVQIPPWPTVSRETSTRAAFHVKRSVGRGAEQRRRTRHRFT